MGFCVENGLQESRVKRFTIIKVRNKSSLDLVGNAKGNEKLHTLKLGPVGSAIKLGKKKSRMPPIVWPDRLEAWSCHILR